MSDEIQFLYILLAIVTAMKNKRFPEPAKKWAKHIRAQLKNLQSQALSRKK